MKRHQSSQSGFALVLTLALLAMLVLLTLAISALSRVDSKLAATSTFQTQAKQTALTALQVALGDLQQHAGADSVVTGMAGVSGVTLASGSRQRNWCAVWPVLAGPTLGEPHWLASGAKTGSTPQIDLPKFSILQIVREGSATIASGSRDFVEVGLLPIESEGPDHVVSTNGSYAYWIADEGVKISAALTDAQAQTFGGAPYRPNAQRLLSQLSQTDSQSGNLISYAQLRQAVAKGGDIKTPFHELTATAVSLPSSLTATTPKAKGYVYGAVNINTTSNSVWQALLESKTSSGQVLNSSGKESNLATKITGDLEKQKRPFVSLDDLLATKLIKTALDTRSPKVTTTTQEAIVDALRPYLAVRSDTFRIRAYGEAINPASAPGKPITESTAYCEAIVQRTPDPSPGGFGKKFVIVYFRWLGPDDV